MKKLLGLVCALALVFSLSAAASAEESNVITISTAEELMAMADDLTADYVLDADIDLEGIDWTPIARLL